MSVIYKDKKPFARCDGDYCSNQLEVKPLDSRDPFARDVIDQAMPTLSRYGWTRSGSGLLYCKFCTNKLRTRRDASWRQRAGG